jgi:hypothetical protein
MSIAAVESVEMLIERAKNTSEPIEKGRLLGQIQSLRKLNYTQLSELFGHSTTWSLAFLHLNSLVDEVAELVRSGKLTLGIAREIGRIVPLERQKKIADIVADLTLIDAKAKIEEIMRPHTDAPSVDASVVSHGGDAIEKRALSQNESRAEIREGTAEYFLRTLGDSDRSLSRLLDMPYSTLRNAFSEPEDLEMARRHLLTSAYRLNEVLQLLEAMERSRR